VNDNYGLLGSGISLWRLPAAFTPAEARKNEYYNYQEQAFRHHLRPCFRGVREAHFTTTISPAMAAQTKVVLISLLASTAQNFSRLALISWQVHQLLILVSGLNADYR
jgi:hypothetical protein